MRLCDFCKVMPGEMRESIKEQEEQEVSLRRMISAVLRCHPQRLTRVCLAHVVVCRVSSFLQTRVCVRVNACASKQKRRVLCLFSFLVSCVEREAALCKEGKEIRVSV